MSDGLEVLEAVVATHAGEVIEDTVVESVVALNGILKFEVGNFLTVGVDDTENALEEVVVLDGRE